MMIELLNGKQVHHAARGAGLGVHGREVDFLDPGVDDGPGAHGTRLKGHEQAAVDQAPGDRKSVV